MSFKLINSLIGMRKNMRGFTRNPLSFILWQLYWTINWSRCTEMETEKQDVAKLAGYKIKLLLG